jgi:hypothetical protein
MSKTILGWLTHYTLGFCLVLVYHIFWSYNFIEVSLLQTILLGVVSGIIGILGWKFLFLITPYRFVVELKGSYIKFFFAHIIFALVATAAYHI